MAGCGSFWSGRSPAVAGEGDQALKCAPGDLGEQFEVAVACQRRENVADRAGGRVQRGGAAGYATVALYY
jgi:hypothetical protein